MGKLKQLLFTVPEAAEILGIGTTKAWELVMCGEIESILIGRSRRISRQALESFVANREGYGS